MHCERFHDRAYKYWVCVEFNGRQRETARTQHSLITDKEIDLRKKKRAQRAKELVSCLRTTHININMPCEQMNKRTEWISTLDSVFSNCSLLRRFVCGRAKSIEHHSAFLWCKSAHAPHLSYSCSFEVFAHFAFIAHRNTVVLIRQLLLLHYIYLPILLSPFRSSPSIYPSMPLSLSWAS